MAVDIGPRIGLDGEKEYRAQLQNVIQAQKTLNSEMKLLASSFDDSTSAEEKARKTGELLARQVDNQKARVALLQSQYDKAAEALGENDTKTLKWKQALNNAQTELNRLEGELEQTENGVDDLSDSMEEAEEETSVFGDVMLANLASKAVLAGLDALKKSIESVANGLKDTVIDSAHFADDMVTMSTVTGLSTDALQEYKYMTELVDVSLDTITGSLTKLTNNMQAAKGGTGAAAEAFNALGVSVMDEEGNLRSNQEVFDETIQALSEVSNETERDAYAMDIFGKSAQELNPLMAAGADGVEALRQEAHEMGYVMGEEALQSLVGVSDSMERVKNTADAAKNMLGEALAPTVEDLAGKAEELIQAVMDHKDEIKSAVEDGVEKAKDVMQWLVDNGPTVAATIAGIGAAFAAWNVGTMILGLANAIKAFKAANEGATVAQAVLNGVMMANPAVLIATIIAALVAGIVVFIATNKNAQEALKKAWDAIKNAVSTAVQTAKSALDGLKTGVSNAVSGVSSAISGVVTTVKTTLTSLPSKALTWGKDFIQGFINGIKAKLSAVAQAAKDIANKVKSFLHFSKPDVGPLRDYQTWAKDFVVGYSKAMRSELPTIGRTAQLMADTMAAPMRSGVTNMGGVSINVYGRDGQSVNELADAVMERMQLMVERKGAIYR